MRLEPGAGAEDRDTFTMSHHSDEGSVMTSGHCRELDTLRTELQVSSSRMSNDKVHFVNYSDRTCRAQSAQTTRQADYFILDIIFISSNFYVRIILKNFENFI